MFDQLTAVILRTILLTIALGMGSSLSAQEGVDFKNMTFDEALHAAKSEDKTLFIDGFASWCGPCKRMDKSTFTDSLVGDYYNDRFVSIKLDMEKEGKEVADKYNVKAFPTFLFLDAEGEVLHKGAGFFEADAFIELAEKSTDTAYRLGTLQSRYDAGDREPDFLRMLLEQKFELLDPTYIDQAEALAELYQDWNSAPVRAHIFKYTNTAISPLYRHMVEHRKDYETQFGRGKVWNKIETLIRDRSYDIEHTSIEEMSDLFALVYPSNAEEIASKYRLSYYRQKGDRQSYADAAIDHYSRFPTKDAEELNEVGVTFSRVIDDTALLNKALALVEKSIQIEDAYYNNDTRAALLFKMGDISRAKSAAEKAISMAKKQNEDATYTEELLEVIISYESQN